MVLYYPTEICIASQSQWAYSNTWQQHFRPWNRCVISLFSSAISKLAKWLCECISQAGKMWPSLGGPSTCSQSWSVCVVCWCKTARGLYSRATLLVKVVAELLVCLHCIWTPEHWMTVWSCVPWMTRRMWFESWSLESCHTYFWEWYFKSFTIFVTLFSSFFMLLAIAKASLWHHNFLLQHFSGRYSTP